MSDPKITRYSFSQLESTAQTGEPKDILAAAWAEAEKVRAQAHAEGEAAGRAEGLAQAQAELAPVLASLAEAIQSLEAAREELAETLTRQAADVALALGEQLVAAALELEPQRVIDIARGALRRLADRHRVTILVNPSDLELMGDAVASLQSELGGIEHLDVQADRRVERGAVVQTEYGEVDASIATQLAGARAVVAAALAGDDGDAPVEAEDDAGFATIPASEREPAAAEVAPDGRL